MADIFDEIDEELKQDRAKAVWLRYGKYVAAAAAAVVLGVGASQGFSAWKQSQAEAAANAYHQALASEDAVGALENQLSSLSDGYATLARFRIAAGKAEGGDAAGAEAAYLEIAADSGLSDLYRQAATLLSAMNAPDTANVSELQGRLAPIADGTGPWRPLALELSAAFDLKAGDRDAALAKLKSIIEMEETPAELRQRAAQLAEVLKS
ncbi:MAG: tetratricopeptide repeat protein [Candidatus Puniceispirillaceae bacterium]